MKQKIKSIINGQDKPWNDKILRKRTILFEDETSGELTLFPDNPEPTIGQELDFEWNDRGYGQEIKINRPGGGGGRPGGGAKKSPKREAMIDTLSVLKSCLESKQITPKDIKGFVAAYHPFFMEFMDEAPVTPPHLANKPANVITPEMEEEDDGLPF